MNTWVKSWSGLAEAQRNGAGIGSGMLSRGIKGAEGFRAEILRGPRLVPVHFVHAVHRYRAPAHSPRGFLPICVRLSPSVVNFLPGIGSESSFTLASLFLPPAPQLNERQAPKTFFALIYLDLP